MNPGDFSKYARKALGPALSEATAGIVRRALGRGAVTGGGRFVLPKGMELRQAENLLSRHGLNVQRSRFPGALPASISPAGARVKPGFKAKPFKEGPPDFTDLAHKTRLGQLDDQLRALSERLGPKEFRPRVQQYLRAKPLAWADAEFYADKMRASSRLPELRSTRDAYERAYRRSIPRDYFGGF